MRQGFSIRLAAHALSALDAYTSGFILSQQTMPVDSEIELKELASMILSNFPKDNLPHLYEFTKDYVLTEDYSYDEEFLFGLELLLDQLENRIK